MAEHDRPEFADRSMGELLGQLSEDTATLVREELNLLRVETVQNGRRLRDDVTDEGARVKAAVTAEVARTSDDLKGEIGRTRGEMASEGKKAAGGAGMVAAGAAFGAAALGALTALLIIVLDSVMPLWLAALLVTLLWAIVAIGLLLTGRDQIRRGVDNLGSALGRSQGEVVALLRESGSRLTTTAQESRERLTAFDPPTPTQTVETLKEDAQWAKTQL